MIISAKHIFLSVILFFLSITTFSQKVNEVTEFFNQDKGTFIIKEVKTKNSIHRDSAILKGKIYNLLLCQEILNIKSEKYAGDVYIDNNKYKINYDGVFELNIKKGKREIMIDDNDPLMDYPLKTTIKFKKRRIYIIDFFIASFI